MSGMSHKKDKWKPYREAQRIDRSSKETIQLMTDNKKLVRQTVLPDDEQIQGAIVAELTELKKIVDKYSELLARVIRHRVQ